MRSRIALACFGALGACLLLVATEASADSFRVPIPGLTGSYDTPGDLREGRFDVGLSFESVQNALIEFEYTGGGQIVCTASIPPSCTDGTRLGVSLGPADGPVPSDAPEGVVSLIGSRAGGRFSISIAFLMGSETPDPALLAGAAAVRLRLLDGSGVQPVTLQAVHVRLEGRTEVANARPARRPEHQRLVSFDDFVIDETRGVAPRSSSLSVYDSGLVVLDDAASFPPASRQFLPAAEFPVELHRLPAQPAPGSPIGLDLTRAFFIDRAEVNALHVELVAAGALRARGVEISDVCSTAGLTPQRTLTLRAERAPMNTVASRRGMRAAAAVGGPFDSRSHTITWSCLRDAQTDRIDTILRKFRLRVFGF